MVTFPKAKINIGLRITGKRDDGFHNIETLFCPIPLCDALEFVVADDKQNSDILVVTGIETGGRPEDNLVMKAVSMLRESYTFPFLKIHLHKAIPAGAGLGGGSSDAAYILNGINKCYGLNLDSKKLKYIALELGSDCPFFIKATPAYGTGRGEILVTYGEQIFNNHYMILLNPGIHVNTGDAYKNCTPASPVHLLSELIENLPADKWKNVIVNDFEDYVFSRHPLVGMLKEELYRSGAIFSLMSGSGSSVYGIYKNKHSVPEKLKEYLVWQGFLHPIQVR
ncbi:MAG TPA: 4-(cytidine 5'-diphospho)-2-C-methyl-D-erythritol kinase [Bacteroidales bacterium]|nr:4-(cytidine 5'-diphospho)-2-C-methyl-D-erythritol kinase [Bacteroidales bacterium]